MAEGTNSNNKPHGGEGDGTPISISLRPLLVGGAGDDTLDGDGWLSGGDGNDFLFGGDGGDCLLGGAGDDSLYGYDGGDWLLGGDGNDFLFGGWGNDFLSGGAGDDDLIGGIYDPLDGNRGENDTLSGGEGDDNLYGGGGNSVYRFNRGDGRDVIWDHQRVMGWELTEVVIDDDHGWELTEVVIDDEYAGERDILELGEGILPSEIITARDGTDLVLGFAGSETDRITITNHFDEKNAIEEIHFADGTVWVWNEYSLSYGQGYTPVTGTAAADAFVGGAGNDYFIGGLGNDTLRGGEGNDVLDGGGDADTLYASRGDDVLYGGEGNDRLYGEAGNDVFRGGAGNDILTDTRGDETYRFAVGDGADTILDTQGEDALIFENIDYTSLWFARTGVNGRNLEISVRGADDKVTITDWFLGASRQIEHIEAGGYVLDGVEVAALVEALANFAPSVSDGDAGCLLLGVLGQYWDGV
ncbi:MAG: hypothetical protein LBF61_10130 [Azoarcus sp.]|jgi:Ca2+-binding RTX toxin-like protein|nr:hypothetical protein [Azoarcus sp.]